MFKTYDEAKNHAKSRAAEDHNYLGIILEKNGCYQTARDYHEADYAETHGWKIVNS